MDDSPRGPGSRKDNEFKATHRAHVNWLERFGDTLDRKPPAGRVYWSSLGLGIILLAISLYLVILSGLIGARDKGLGPNDVDLSGAWKIKFEDSPGLADPKLPDADWCLINVPNSGITPQILPNDRPSKLCPKENYPAKQMRGAVYWYRKTFDLSNNRNFATPALFLGSVKNEAWVYLDNQLIGSARYETQPSILLIPLNALAAGRHLLAVRVNSESYHGAYPGIFHAYDRKVSIGEFAEVAQALKVSKQQYDVEPFAVAFLQFMALMLLVFLMIRSGTSNENFFWLTLYFGSAAVYSAVAPMSGTIIWYCNNIAFIGMSIALVGFGITILTDPLAKNYLSRRITLLVGIISVAAETLAALRSAYESVIFASLDRVIIAASLFTLIALSAKRVISARKQSVRIDILKTDLLVLLCLGMIHTGHAIERIFGSNYALFIHSPLATSLLTFVVMMLAIENHVNKERQLAFFGRFIRRGLKDLLSQEKKRVPGDKIFRGKRIPIMIIDVVDHTKTTFGMPYGVKRLFQDLWFTHVDHVVSEKIFLDKNAGDGSIYYFDENLPGGSCSNAVMAAQEIIEKIVSEFDRDFNANLTNFLRATPEIIGPMNRFMAEYKKLTGTGFLDRKTKVRVVLVYGFVDEGLWGLTSQSHYDVQGDLVTVAARLEKHASAGEILISAEFVDAWKEEQLTGIEGFELDWREADLKGIGTKKFVILKSKKQKTQAAA